MANPFFFEEHLPAVNSFSLNEETSRHVVQVLRMRAGERINLTNGKGQLISAEITTPDKKGTIVKLLSADEFLRPVSKVTIALSLLKNENRFEWFVEKATETGVTSILPLICERTEKQHFRYERMKKIMISAMLQSQQGWMPVLEEPATCEGVIKRNGFVQKFIAHCAGEQKTSLKNVEKTQGDKIILIGPEGDFTAGEIALSMEHNFIPVSLGNTRLRTETAGVYAAVILQAE
ncbi:MAG: RsmE family RNA methyltransferase [Ginsengibacter sp.]